MVQLPAREGTLTERAVRPAPPRPHAFDTILLATDLGPASSAATEQAIAMAAALGARLLVVNVLDTRRVLMPGRHERIDQARAEREPLLLELIQRARAAAVSAEYLLWPGDPGEAILSAVEAEHADMVIVGSHGRDRAGRLLLGSVSDHLVRNAGCPVLVVRPTEAEAGGPTTSGSASPATQGP
jgi:universal stress protein A